MNLRNLFRQIAVTATSLLLVFGVATIAQACPGCKDALAAADPAHQHIVRGYFWSILFMMGMPYCTLGCFCGYMYLLVKKSRAAKESQDDKTDSSGPSS